MSWKKHFKIIQTGNTPKVNLNSVNNNTDFNIGNSKYSSYLNTIYAGHPNRIQRYYQFEDMSKDPTIKVALDIIADFCTQSEEQSKDPFEVVYNDDEVNETEVKILKDSLTKWVKLNTFKQRLWWMFRDCIKNGDIFFLRDPETLEWIWEDHFNVELVRVDDNKGKEPIEYVIRGFDYNKSAKYGTKKADPNQYRTPLGTQLGVNGAARPNASPMGGQNNVFQLTGSGKDSRSQNGQEMNESIVVDAKHVIHLGLSVGTDINWPFGTSVLEPLFKTFKQKELLEDAILIYRIQRAPERRVFKIDVGDMPPAKANAYIERLKNEIHSRRIPNKTGGGSNIIDAAYNPLAVLDDFFFSTNGAGRGSSVEVLPGGECLALDTKIPLLDGRTLELQEIIKEFNDGKSLWAYSCNPENGEFAPGKITWAGDTRKNTEVIKLTFDNGKSVVCTPDHKFPILTKGFIEAKNIELNEIMISFDNIDIKLVSIEYLSEKQDTGTLTIDAYEMIHGYHTFALDCGIYTKNSTGEISDLEWFSRKLVQGLSIPPSYLPVDHTSEGSSYNDGRVGTAMIQEFLFNKYCMRLQSLMAPVFDREFKRYLKESGLEIDSSIFELQFHPPQNFSKYRQIEVDQAQMGVYSQVADNKKLSERFKLKRFLNLTEEELLENERLWKEENAEKLKAKTGTTPAESENQDGLNALGIRDSDFDGMPGEDGFDLEGGEESPEGMEGGDASGGDLGGNLGGSAGNAPPSGGGEGPL